MSNDTYRRTARILLVGTLLSLLTSGVVVGQTVQQRQPSAGTAEATPKQPAPGETQTPQPNWTMNCGNTPKGLDCRAVQSLFLRKTGQRLISVVVHMPPGTKSELLIQLPLGVYLPVGASLQIGKDAAKTLPYKSCDQYGCIADYPITEAEIGAMSKGSDLAITMQNFNQKPITVTVPSLGFAAAYAKIR